MKLKQLRDEADSNGVGGGKTAPSDDLKICELKQLHTNLKAHVKILGWTQGLKEIKHIKK